MNIAIREFLQGFGPGFLFSSRRRPGAATQVFATEDVPCDEEVQQTADQLTGWLKDAADKAI